MLYRIYKIVFCVVAVAAPCFLFAQPTFGSTLPDVAPIDQQTLLLASGGVIYAISKLRQHRKK
ncbi:MAG: hypothetical protein ACHQK8_04880 [Bacteroidia bacterium]